MFAKVGRNDEVLFALIKTKCLPIYFMASKHVQRIHLIRQSFEFTINKILFILFGAMSTDSYRYIYECSGIDNVDQF